jgi:hypothetical protein
LLRGTVGITAATQGWPCVATTNTTLLGAISASALVVCGVALTIGTFTRVTSSLVALGYALAPFGPFDGAVLPRFDGPAATVVGVAAAAALGLLGPGAFSIDARRFGRREVFIPARDRSEEL